MTTLLLLIGNKNYSSWSLRPWILLKEKKIPFQERKILFGKQSTGVDDTFKKQVKQLSQSGKVPCLIEHNNNNFAVWDSLAIIEYLHEKFPQLGIYPVDQQARAECRSIICEMHSGFNHMRGNLVMNIVARFPELGSKILQENQGVKGDVDRVVDIWMFLLNKYGGPFLFGKSFTAADAFYAPVTTRFITYNVALPRQAQRYVEMINGLDSMKEWKKDAEEEMNKNNPEFVPYLEMYRKNKL
jgi:glutathione S-transferase